MDDELTALLQDEQNLDLIAKATDQRSLGGLATGAVEHKGLVEEAGNARRQYRQVCIRLDGGVYAILARIAMRSRVSPTTMARILLRKALANAVSDPADRPLP